MSKSGDRLKQIWQGFESRTTRKLTGSGVDNIPRPQIEEMERHRSLLETAHKAASVPMPDGLEEPSKAAFDALRSRLTSFDQKGRPEKKQYTPAAEPAVSMTAAETLHTEQLLRDLKVTENLTSRRELDYMGYAAKMQAERDSRRKRKKFLGLF